MATATLSDSTVEPIGSETDWSTRARPSGERPAPSLPTTSASRVGRLHAFERSTAGVRAPQRDRMASAERIELVPGTHESGAVKERAHRTSDDLGVPEVNGSGHREDGRRPERGGRAEDRADVAGILDRVEHDEPGAAR